MTISLKKGGNISLEKVSPGLTSVSLGLGWGKKKKGFFGKKIEVDLDAACLLFHDNNGNQTEDLTGITQDIWYEWGVGVLSSVENNFNNSVSIYPNPTNDILFIETTTDIHSFQCYDTLRKMVLKGQIRNNKINVSTLSNGIYLLKLQDNNSFIYSKIIIKK